MMKKQEIILTTVFVSGAILAVFKFSSSVKVNNSKNINNDNQAISQIPTQELTIQTNGCRGCGRCAKIDPSHFQMNITTGKAKVISTENFDSIYLIQAIRNCPAKAISLK